MGPPINWRLDTSAAPQLVEVEDRHDPALNPEIGSPGAPSSGAGGRAGEKRSIYLFRKDFEKYGYTDGCRVPRYRERQAATGELPVPPQCRLQKAHGARYQNR